MYTINKKCSLLFFVQNAILNVYRKIAAATAHASGARLKNSYFEAPTDPGSLDNSYTSYATVGTTPTPYLKGGIGGKDGDDLSVYMEYKNVPKTGFNTGSKYANQFAASVYVRRIGKDKDNTPVTTKFKIFVKDIPQVNIWMVGRWYSETNTGGSPDSQSVFTITNTLYKNNAWNDIAITLRVEDGKPIYDYYINNIYCMSTTSGTGKTPDLVNTHTYQSNRVRIQVRFPAQASETLRNGMVAIDDCSGMDGKFDSLIDDNRSSETYAVTQDSSYGFDDALKSVSIANPADYISDYGSSAPAQVRCLLTTG